MSKQKIFIIAVSLVMAGFIAWTIWSVIKQETPKPLEDQSQSDTSQQNNNEPNSIEKQEVTNDSTLPSDETITSYLVSENPGLVNSATNIPLFTISQKSEPLPGWFVIKIRNDNDPSTSDAYVVLRNLDSKLTIIAGPGTGLHFNKTLPNEVREAMN